MCGGCVCLAFPPAGVWEFHMDVILVQVTRCRLIDKARVEGNVYILRRAKGQYVCMFVCFYTKIYVQWSSPRLLYT